MKFYEGFYLLFKQKARMPILALDNPMVIWLPDLREEDCRVSGGCRILAMTGGLGNSVTG
ncbi:MAG: hypothetical protein JW996_05865 [Candidatus Cloacimonetes bacterium]|nr:hypothetical protein [Candidatus Cloacimonadota bacterium]